MKRKLRREQHTPRHQFGAPRELWEAFKKLHGPRNASARLRALIAQDIAQHSTRNENGPGLGTRGRDAQQTYNA